MFECLPDGGTCGDGLSILGSGGVELFQRIEEEVDVLADAVGVRVVEPGGIFAQFAGHAGDGETTQSLLTGGMEAVGNEVPHADETGIRDAGKVAFCSALSAASGAEDDFVESGQAGRPHADADGFDVGFVAEGADDARRPENRNPAEDAELGIEGFCRQLFAVFDADFRDETSGERGSFCQIIGDHATWTDVDRPAILFAIQPRACAESYSFDGAENEHAFSCMEHVVVFSGFVGSAPPDAGVNFSKVRAVGIVASILDGRGKTGGLIFHNQDAVFAIRKENYPLGGMPTQTGTQGFPCRHDDSRDAGSRGVALSQVSACRRRRHDWR